MKPIYFQSVSLPKLQDEDVLPENDLLEIIKKVDFDRLSTLCLSSKKIYRIVFSQIDQIFSKEKNPAIAAAKIFLNTYIKASKQHQNREATTLLNKENINSLDSTTRNYIFELAAQHNLLQVLSAMLAAWYVPSTEVCSNAICRAIQARHLSEPIQIQVQKKTDMKVVKLLRNSESFFKHDPLSCDLHKRKFRNAAPARRFKNNNDFNKESSFKSAVKNNNIFMLKTLLLLERKNPNPNSFADYSHYFNFSLNLALEYKCNKETIKFLLESDPSTIGKHRVEILSWAAENDEREILLSILKTMDPEKKWCLDAMHRAIQKGHHEIIKLFINYRKNILASVDHFPLPSLAIKLNDTEMLKLLLKYEDTHRCKCRFNTCHQEKNLLAALKYSNKDALQLLLKHYRMDELGILLSNHEDIFMQLCKEENAALTQSDLNERIIKKAAASNNIAILSYMLKNKKFNPQAWMAGIRAAIIENKHDAIRFFLQQENAYSNQEWFCHLVIKGNHLEALDLILKYQKINSDANRRALRLAFDLNHIDQVRLLLEQGSSDFNDALLKGAAKGWLDIVALALEKGAKPATFKSASLKTAMQNGFFDIALLLLKEGTSDISVCQDFDLNALIDFAIEKNQYEIVIKLISFFQKNKKLSEKIKTCFSSINTRGNINDTRHEPESLIINFFSS